MEMENGMTMVEKVARAISAELEDYGFEPYEIWDPDVVWINKIAIKAIEAMRTPTEAMLQAGAIADDNFSEAAPETASLRIYGAMIGAALKDV